VPPAQKRLIAFGEDQKVRVDHELKAKGMISEIILAKAMITVNRLVRDTTVYRVTNDDSKPRKFVVDHPRADGLTLASPPRDGTSAAVNDISIANCMTHSNHDWKRWYVTRGELPKEGPNVMRSLEEILRDDA
jgi:hypothetical protein